MRVAASNRSNHPWRQVLDLDRQSEQPLLHRVKAVSSKYPAALLRRVIPVTSKWWYWSMGKSAPAKQSLNERCSTSNVLVRRVANTLGKFIFKVGGKKSTNTGQRRSFANDQAIPHSRCSEVARTGLSPSLRRAIRCRACRGCASSTYVPNSARRLGNWDWRRWTMLECI
jgi:hypothetical protein